MINNNNNFGAKLILIKLILDELILAKLTMTKPITRLN